MRAVSGVHVDGSTPCDPTRAQEEITKVSSWIDPGETPTCVTHIPSKVFPKPDNRPPRRHLGPRESRFAPRSGLEGETARPLEPVVIYTDDPIQRRWWWAAVSLLVMLCALIAMHARLPRRSEEPEAARVARVPFGT
ncbi:MAG: hypothetical protein WBG86_13815 [Polyangiales bacterium]